MARGIFWHARSFGGAPVQWEEVMYYSRRAQKYHGPRDRARRKNSGVGDGVLRCLRGALGIARRSCSGCPGCARNPQQERFASCGIAAHRVWQKQSAVVVQLGVAKEPYYQGRAVGAENLGFGAEKLVVLVMAVVEKPILRSPSLNPSDHLIRNEWCLRQAEL